MNASAAYLVLPFASVLRVLNPDSPQARAIFNLGVVASIILGIIFVIVAGIIAYALIRYRTHQGDPDPRQVAGHQTLELVWTAIPCAIVGVLFLLTARTMDRSDPPPTPEPDIVIIGHQWWWEVHYPGSGVVTANEIHIPAGQAMSVRLESGDVLHEFWVAELTRKMTTVPGHPNHIWLQADKPGIYLGLCSEFCGTEHAWMHFLVVAEPKTEFETWTKAQLQRATVPAGGAAARGLALFQQTSCVSCHAINGTSARARVGPDLTHFASRHQLGAGIADNTSENLRRWLADPQKVKPGVKMPSFQFTNEQLMQLSAYFKTLQ